MAQDGPKGAQGDPDGVPDVLTRLESLERLLAMIQELDERCAGPIRIELRAYSKHTGEDFHPPEERPVLFAEELEDDLHQAIESHSIIQSLTHLAGQIGTVFRGESI